MDYRLAQRSLVPTEHEGATPDTESRASLGGRLYTGPLQSRKQGPHGQGLQGQPAKRGLARVAKCGIPLTGTGRRPGEPFFGKSVARGPSDRALITIARQPLNAVSHSPCGKVVGLHTAHLALTHWFSQHHPNLGRPPLPAPTHPVESLGSAIPIHPTDSRALTLLP